jgi:5-guanidino-2-oxopentanoate decarboxylase
MQKRAELSVGEALVGLLEAYGVTTIFGIPGVHNVEMYRALPRSQIKHVLVRHEQGAGFMADGYARATGKPGVCFTITGPGLTNILTPMGQAWSDSSPMLVISTALDIGDSAQGRGRLHEMVNQFAAAQAVTTQARIAQTADDIRDAIAEAFAGFASQRPRPAYLEIPLDLLNEPASGDWQARHLPSRPQASDADLAKAAGLLSKAKKPLIVLGGGALDAGAAALRIAESLQAPILTTTAGKGAVPEDHPLARGYCLARESGRALLNDSDLILAAGSELSETDFWESRVAIGAPLIRIDIDPASLVRPYAATLAILADAKSALTGIAGLIALERQTAANTPAATEESELRTMLKRVLAVIREALPRDAVVASDMTQIAYAANEVFPVYEPRTWLHPVGFGTLGFALPAAIGAKFGRPDTPVVALMGDYGLQYTVNEIGTAAEHRLALPILMWNNNALGQIRDDMVNKGIQPNAVTLVNPDFQALARAYACHAERPATLKALATAIISALKSDRPTLIEMTPAMAKA